jgi:hypothetical protein
MKRIKYAILKWLGFIKYPDIKVNGMFGLNCNYNKLTVLTACDIFIRQWKIHYGRNIEYLFHGLTINFSPKPIIDLKGEENFGIADIHTITVWQNAKSLGDTAFTHELVHYIKWSLNGNPDGKHKDQEWGENFESPVKRLIKADGL